MYWREFRNPKGILMYGLLVRLMEVRSRKGRDVVDEIMSRVHEFSDIGVLSSVAKHTIIMDTIEQL